MKVLDSWMNRIQASCSMRDEGRPFEIGLQDQVSNHPRVMRIKSVCGERLGKRWSKRLHQVCTEKMNESEPPMQRRKCKDVIETKLWALAWDKVWGTPVYCPSGDRRRGGMSSVTGSYGERGNLSFRCQGRSSSGSPTRGRVPMRSTGADQLVVVMKFGNMNGAKGLNCPALSNESTRDGKNEIERAMTREWCFISPSRLDNKSRMRRESHVRFCERWGVRFPLPTRQVP